MRNITTTLCALFLSGMAFGQNILQTQFSHYLEQENFTRVQVSQKAFELAAYLELEESPQELQEFQAFLQTVRSFDLIAGHTLENANLKQQTALKQVRATHEELMQVEEEDGIFTFLMDETQGVVHELVMVGGNAENLIIFSLTGNMDLNQLSKMSRLMQAEQEAPLSRLFENGIHEVKVFPNPIAKGEPIMIETPAEMAGGMVSLLNLNGTRISSVPIQGQSQKLITHGLAAGTYILEFKQENVSIRKKVILQ